MNILFVCTGNTCRSPMAEGLMKILLKKQNQNEIYVSSAGVSACDGLFASTNAQIAAKNRGADISLHSSRRVDKHMLASADLILCMTKSHKNQLCSMFSDYKNKIYTLPEYVHCNCYADSTGPDEISDPFGGDIEEYEKCASDLECLLVKLLEKVCLNGNSKL